MRFPIQSEKYLWEKYKDTRVNKSYDVFEQFTGNVSNEVLVSIADICLAIGNKGLVHSGVCAPNRSANDVYYRDSQRGIHFDVDDLGIFVETNLPKLVPEHRVAYDTIMRSQIKAPDRTL
jgi:hypothetical protein